MPATEVHLPGGAREFILRPNGSLDPAGARRFLWVVGGSAAAIGLYFASRGLWPILPFAGLEVAVLAWALSASLRDSRRRETIVVDHESVRVEWHDHSGTRRAEFSRHWARVRVSAAPVRNHPSRLVIESHGKGREVGRFLAEEERLEMAVRLRKLIGTVSISPPLDAIADPTFKASDEQG
jgi:uncharacterized membrane protein